MKSKGRKKVKLDNKRSLFDDPRLQRMKLNPHKSVMEALGGQFHVKAEKTKWF